MNDHWGVGYMRAVGVDQDGIAADAIFDVSKSWRLLPESWFRTPLHFQELQGKLVMMLWRSGMRSRSVVGYLVLLAVAWFTTVTSAAADKPIRLLRQPGAALIATTAVGLPRSEIARLTDPQRATPVEFQLDPGVPVDLTWRLPSVATCANFIVTMVARDLTVKRFPQVELLVSTLSAHSGFQTVRALSLRKTDAPQSQRLPQLAARWLIVRLQSPVAVTVPLIAIEIRGQLGPPQSEYGFKETPARAFAVLEEVQKSVEITLHEREEDLYRDAADGKLSQWSFAEAALLSSGVHDALQRRKYLTQLDEITAASKVAVGPDATPYERGERLLEWLHETVMVNGYEEDQTDLATLLRNGKFNCVSSATLYNIVGRRLGLDLRAVEVPEHAFSILYNGTRHADAETTIAAGFNPARDKNALTLFQQQTGFQYIPDRKADQRREVRETGLLALTCYNHGVHHAEQRAYPQALADYFRALSLDPEFPAAIQGVLGVFARWGHELAENMDYQQAIQVVTAGLRLAPQDRTLLHNHRVTLQKWAVAEIEGGRQESALQVLHAAHRTLPNAGFDGMQSYVYIYPGEKQAQKKQWEQALTLAETGLATVAEAAHQELKGWRNSVYQRWSQAAMAQQNFAEAVDVLNRALEADPDERRFRQNRAYIIQEWLAGTLASSGVAEAEQLLGEITSRFQGQQRVQRVTDRFLQSMVATRLPQNADEALALIERQRRTASNNVVRDLRRLVFDRQVMTLLANEQWKAAAQIYLEGLKVLPRDRHLRKNLVAVWDQWASGLLKKQDWHAAVDVYVQAMESGIDERGFGRKLAYSVQEHARALRNTKGTTAAEQQIRLWQIRLTKLTELQKVALSYVQNEVRQHQQEKQHKMALLAVDRCRSLIDQKGYQRLVRQVCDLWSQTQRKQQAWQPALDVYTRGLKRLPGDRHLVTNATATWHQWAAIYIKQKQWEKAIEIYQQALKQFPRDRKLQNNLKFCQQQQDQID